VLVTPQSDYSVNELVEPSPPTPVISTPTLAGGGGGACITKPGGTANGLGVGENGINVDVGEHVVAPDNALFVNKFICWVEY
jgi:hypothetical protein